MLLNAEVKDDAYADLPRQQEQAQYAQPTSAYLKTEAGTGKTYVDLNAAAKSYSGAWLFGRQNVVVNVGNLRADWVQSCPIPAGIADGVLLRGNVIYQNPDGTNRQSSDQFEGVIRTEGNTRYFVGQTQHSFYGRNFRGGSIRVVADLNIPLSERMAYNPMVVLPVRRTAYANPAPENYYGSRPYQQPYQPRDPATYPSSGAAMEQDPDPGF